MSEEQTFDEKSIKEALEEVERINNEREAVQTMKGCAIIIFVLIAFIDVILINSALLVLLLQSFNVM